MTITIPTNSAELEDFLGSGEKMAQLFQDGKPTAAFSEFVKNYATAAREKDASISEQIRNEVERVNREWLAGEGPKARLPLGIENGSAPKIQGYSATAPGAKLDALFNGPRSTADYFSAIHHDAGRRNPENFNTQDEIRKIQNAYGSTVPSDGGFLIPEVLRATLLATALETAVVRPRATVVPMDSLSVPFPTIDQTTHAGSVHGGLAGFWTEESAQLVASQARFGRVVLNAKKLTVYGEAPNELFADSAISFQAFIDQKLPEALSWFEDIAFINGTGVGEPLGWLKADAAVTVAAEGGQTATTIVWNNIVKMYARMLPASLGRAVWVANIDTFPQLATMALSVGTGGGPVWIGTPGQSGAATPPVTILGRPVIFTEKVPTLGAIGDINFVDLDYYLIGDRQAMQASTSPHYKFQNDQTVFRVIERVDGRPWIESAITPASGSGNTLSPFVKIAAR